MTEEAVLNAAYELTKADQKPFRGDPVRKRFASGTRLHRFVTRGENRVEGPWWFTSAVLRRIRLHALKAGLPLTSVARPWLAVSHHWNTRMDFLVTAELECDAIGWVGAARHQHYDDEPENAHVVWIGGAEQVYLPNLLSDTRQTSDAVRAAHKGLPIPRARIVDHEKL